MFAGLCLKTVSEVMRLCFRMQVEELDVSMLFQSIYKEN